MRNENGKYKTFLAVSYRLHDRRKRPMPSHAIKLIGLQSAALHRKRRTIMAMYQSDYTRFMNEFLEQNLSISVQ